mmetsp:Transcript_28683/g.77766  ORF Transcript_28683/g.77766 Transcript_28683/m.77766 type:complete len:92 (+) Transcript_28683:87-362(+)
MPSNVCWLASEGRASASCRCDVVSIGGATGTAMGAGTARQEGDRHREGVVCLESAPAPPAAEDAGVDGPSLSSSELDPCCRGAGAECDRRW